MKWATSNKKHRNIYKKSMRRKKFSSVNLSRLGKTDVDNNIKLLFLLCPNWLRIFSAYKLTYADSLVWQPYKRNHKGAIPPEKTRKTCIVRALICIIYLTFVQRVKLVLYYIEMSGIFFNSIAHLFYNSLL